MLVYASGPLFSMNRGFEASRLRGFEAPRLKLGKENTYEGQETMANAKQNKTAIKKTAGRFSRLRQQLRPTGQRPTQHARW